MVQFTRLEARACMSLINGNCFLPGADHSGWLCPIPMILISLGTAEQQHVPIYP